MASVQFECYASGLVHVLTSIYVHFFLSVYAEHELFLVIIRKYITAWPTTKLLLKLFIGAGMKSKLGIQIDMTIFVSVIPTFCYGYHLSI